MVVAATPCCASSRARSGTRTARPRSRSPTRWGATPEYPHYTPPGGVARLARPGRPAVGPPRARSASGAARSREPEPRTGTTGLGRSATMIARPGGIGELPHRGRPIAGRHALPAFFTMSTVIESLERAQLRRVPSFQAGRPRPRPLPGHRGHAAPHPGLRGRRHQAPGPRRARDLHRPQAVLRRRRRAHVPGALAEDREDRGRRPRRRAARQALLPARPRRQARPRARAPLHRPGGGRRAAACSTTRRRSRGRRPRPSRGGRRRGRRPRGPVEEAVEAEPPRRAETPPRSRREPRPQARRRGRGRGRGGRRRPTRVARQPRRRQRSGSTLRRTARARCSSWSSSSRSRSASRSASRPSWSSRTGSRAESMVPTLEVGQRVLVNRIGDRFGDPDVGDIIVFHPPAGRRRTTPCGAGQPPAGPAPATSRRRREPT